MIKVGSESLHFMLDNQEIKTLYVFTNNNGDYGNPVGVIVDDKNRLDNIQRLLIAQRLGYSESVFIDKIDTGTVSIYNPQQEVRFAGHALIGVSWYLRERLTAKTSHIKCLAGNIKTWEDSGLTWISSSLNVLPSWYFEQVDDVENVDSNKSHTFVWAWIDKDKGIIRARTFAPDWGIPEDEANGSGSMILTANLKRSLTIIHGKGSLITTKFISDNEIAVGGRVIERK